MSENFLPNSNRAKNPLPAPFSLLVNEINIWFAVSNVVGGRAFPVKTFNRLSLSLPPL